MKANVLITLLKTTLLAKTNKLTKQNQELNKNTYRKNETEGNDEHCLKAYATMGVLQLV